MGTHYTPYAYLDVPRDSVPGVLDAIETALRDAELITGDHDPDAAYNSKGRVFRPGPRSGLRTEAHDVGNGTILYSINGVVLAAGPYMNHGPFIVTPDFDCPACQRHFGHDTAEAKTMQERCFDMFQAYFEGDSSRDVTCLACEVASDVNDWFGPVDFILGDVAVEFWEWPDAAMAQAIPVMDKAAGAKARGGYGIKV